MEKSHTTGADGYSVCACATLRSLMSVSAGSPEAATKTIAVDGGLRGERFRVRVVNNLPCLTCRRCQNIERRLGCLWQNVTAKYFRIIRGNQVVLVWNSHRVSNLYRLYKA